MAKPPQILQLNPANEIVLQGPFDHVVTSYLELYNPSDQRVCFKVKTTAPRRYCVRPNSGIILPANKVKIAIMLQPIENDSQTERNRHKFMVQSVVATDDSHPDSVWLDAEPEEIMDSKLRCVFQMPSLSEAPESPQASIATSDVANSQSKVISSSPAFSSKQQPFINSTQSKKEQQINKSQAIAGDRGGTEQQQTPVASKNVSNQQLKKTPGSDDSSNKSIASQNLTSSFLKPMSDDYKLVILSLVMLFIGVLLGRYVI